MYESQLTQTCHKGLCSALSRCVCVGGGQDRMRQNKWLETKNADLKLMKKCLLVDRFSKWNDSGVTRLEIILVLVLWMVLSI